MSGRNGRPGRRYDEEPGWPLAERERWHSNSRETFEAMAAMRDTINEHIPMPSLESDLLSGPESSVFCARVAEAVVGAIAAKDAEIDRLQDMYERATPHLSHENNWMKRTKAAEARIAELEKERNALRAACNHARAALAGYVSVQSAVYLLDDLPAWVEADRAALKEHSNEA